jgi:uncharacterized protein
MMPNAMVRCLLVAAATVGLAAQSVRVVDSVIVGTAGDENSHHFAGSDTTAGASGGRTWRSTTGWFSYSLRIYDDSPLTLVCLLQDGSGSIDSFDVFVDGQKVPAMTRTPAGKAGESECKVSLPLAATAGKTDIVVKVAARAGQPTARLLELRSVQEHLE